MEINKKYVATFIATLLMGVAFGMQEITNQMSNAIIALVLIFLAIPSTAFIIFIIWFVKKINEVSYSF